MPPAKVETYENLLRYYNKGVFQQVQCECGKIITENKLDTHKQSNIHNLLMRYKEQHTKMKEKLDFKIIPDSERRYVVIPH